MYEYYHIRTRIHTLCLGFLKLLTRHLPKQPHNKTCVEKKKNQVNISGEDYLKMFMRYLFLLSKLILCWYSFELPQIVEAIQMRTNNI